MKPRQSKKKIDALFAGPGEIAERMRATDWSKTPLGPVESWPQSLKTSASICLESRFPILIWWGPKFVKLYNDKYIEMIGTKHPGALGGQGREVWPEIWDTIGPMLKGVLEKAEASRSEDLQLLLDRNGYLEECYFTFSYSPIRDESGGVGGVFTPVMETTSWMLAARRERTLRKLRVAAGSRPRHAKDVCSFALKALSSNVFDVPFAAVYLLPSGTEKSTAAMLAADTCAGEKPMAFPQTIDVNDCGWISWRQLVRGEASEIDLRAVDLGALPVEPWGAAPERAIAVPILETKTAQPIGFVLAGVSVRKHLDEDYRAFFQALAEQIAAAIRDTETLARQRSLRAEAEAERTKIRELFLQAPVAIATLQGPDHRFTLANERYVRLVGRKSDGELIGKSVAEALPELAGQGILEMLDRVYTTGVAETGNELPIKLERGSNQTADAYFTFIFQPARDAEGRIEGILVLAIEATEEVTARLESETREEQFRVLADSIPQLAWMANADGSIIWYNRRWYEYTGTSFEQMQGWGWQSLHSPEFLPKVIARYKHSIETGDPFEMGFPLRGADGKYRPFLTLALPVRDSSGRIIRWFGTNTNMEAQHKSEAALRQSEKLAAVGRLAASIAHEINNPLEGVTNLIYLARMAADNHETKTYLSAAEKELERVSQITNQTLRFHKQQTAATATDVSELLDSILTLYRGKLSREGIQLKLEKRDSPLLVCYAGEVRQVLANLVGNALDAMHKGGRLWIRLRPGTVWRKGRPGIRFTIADTGHGMPPDVRKHIYEPFFTTKGDVGTGLGLWVCAGIVDKGGGSIHVRSSTAPGRSGTVFTLTFPDAPPLPAEGQSSKPAGQSAVNP